MTRKRRLITGLAAAILVAAIALAWASSQLPWAPTAHALLARESSAASSRVRWLAQRAASRLGCTPAAEAVGWRQVEDAIARSRAGAAEAEGVLAALRRRASLVSHQKDPVFVMPAYARRAYAAFRPVWVAAFCWEARARLNGLGAYPRRVLYVAVGVQPPYPVLAELTSP